MVVVGRLAPDLAEACGWAESAAASTPSPRAMGDRAVVAAWVTEHAAVTYRWMLPMSGTGGRRATPNRTPPFEPWPLPARNRGSCASSVDQTAGIRQVPALRIRKPPRLVGGETSDGAGLASTMR